MSSATSGLFSVRPAPPTTQPSLQVMITFDPPLDTDQAPRNLKVDAKEANNNLTGNIVVQPNPTNQQAQAPPGLLGYNIYRVPARPDGSLPPVSEIVQDQNLIGSMPPDTTTFMDSVSTTKGNNFVYSSSSFFSTGTNNGSNPASTNLPVIKNPRFSKGTIFIDTSGSFIKEGAVLCVNDKDSFTLQPDGTGINFTVDKKKPGSGGQKIKKVLKKNVQVNLTVKNPDGKVSVAIPFTRR
jgi:hypothetical protein